MVVLVGHLVLEKKMVVLVVEMVVLVGHLVLEKKMVVLVQMRFECHHLGILSRIL
jgi:hypothetical protein